MTKNVINLLGVAGALIAQTVGAMLTPQSVVIVANANMPESKHLAVYYADKRGIPRSHICFLPLPTNEVISRKLYESDLRDRLMVFLQARQLVWAANRAAKTVKAHETPWHVESQKVRVLVLMYGVPVRIEDTRWLPLRKLSDRRHILSEKNTAAVESELSLLLAPPYAIGGYVPNPLFRRLDPDEKAATRVLIVTRLDGPSPEVVQAIIDRTLDAETRGLLGRGYFDAMGSRRGGYHIGDHWIREACHRFEREGFECVLDDEPQLFDRGYPMESAAIYFGWYASGVVGPMARADFRFEPGALAGHIHSSSAARLRTDSEYWVGPLLARGVCATWGAVSEPYLSGMPHLDVLADRLCSGWTLGESMYAALPMLSWQVAVVGDPLYTPFRLSLDDQIERLEANGDPNVQWAYVRKVNVLAREGRLHAALAYGQAKAATGEHLALVEKLGDLCAANEMWTEANASYEYVIERARTAETAVRVALRWFPLLRKAGQHDVAKRWEKEIREKWPQNLVAGVLAEASENLVLLTTSSGNSK